VRVKEVAVGMGPRIYSHEGGRGTVFSVRLLPLGGFTEPLGEGPGSLAEASWKQRLFIMFAGMLANVGMAFLLLAWLYRHDVPRRSLPRAAFLGSFVLWLVMPARIIVGIKRHGWKFFSVMASGPVGILMGKGGNAPDDEAPAPTVPARTGPELVGRLLCDLSVAIAGFNLLPFYPLDGGQAAGVLVELVVGKPAFSVYKIVSAAIFMTFALLIVLGDFAWSIKNARRR
jgi:membrane-associated protease RseP (regulator of RpoE activity)